MIGFGFVYAQLGFHYPQLRVTLSVTSVFKRLDFE